MQCPSCHNFLHKKNSYLHALQGNGEMGARYLDPKYSRWISVDPALGEYVPGAGKANAKDAGGLPGMGGVFNAVNLSLFHYAGNNPIRYIDPDGRKINLSNTRKENYDAILFIINQMSILQYKITNDGKLEIDAGTLNRNGSETFNRDMLYAFCSSFDIYIFFLNIDYNGYDVIGGTTYFYENEKKVDIIITIDNYPTMKGKNGNYYVPSTKRLFAHELSGHAVPEIKNENGNAVSIENEICRQMNWIEREEEPDHASF